MEQLYLRLYTLPPHQLLANLANKEKFSCCTRENEAVIFKVMYSPPSPTFSKSCSAIGYLTWDDTSLHFVKINLNAAWFFRYSWILAQQKVNRKAFMIDTAKPRILETFSIFAFIVYIWYNIHYVKFLCCTVEWADFL